MLSLAFRPTRKACNILGLFQKYKALKLINTIQLYVKSSPIIICCWPFILGILHSPKLHRCSYSVQTSGLECTFDIHFRDPVNSRQFLINQRYGATCADDCGYLFVSKIDASPTCSYDSRSPAPMIVYGKNNNTCVSFESEGKSWANQYINV